MAAGVFRLVHPFPSLLDAAVVAAISAVAGAPTAVVLRLALGMAALQFTIGIVNDVVDLRTDRLSRRGKPLVRGLLRPAEAVALATLTCAVGLLVSASVGPLGLAIGCGGLATGLLYDMRVKGTPLSWLPFAVGVGLLPLYGWGGGVGCLPPGLGPVFALAVGAGAALASANALADLDHDVASDTRSIATFLGRERTLAMDAGLLLALAASALGATLALAPAPSLLTAELAASGVVSAGVVISARRRGDPLGWEVQAVGVAVLGAAFIAALASSGLLAC